MLLAVELVWRCGSLPKELTGILVAESGEGNIRTPAEGKIDIKN